VVALVRHRNDRYGTAVAGIGDVNGNGVPDILVGAVWAEPPAPSQSGQGAVWVLDGANGAPIYVVYGPPVPGQAGGSEYGRVVGAVGDQDGDGIDDFAVASGWTPFIADLRSGADGALIRHLDMPTGALLAQTIDSMRDIDSDGTEEFVIGFSGTCDGHPALSGMVAVYQGGGQAILTVLCGEVAGEDSGRGICAAGDLDGDGVPDVLVGSRLSGPGGAAPMPPWGYLRAYCGVDLSPLFVYSPPADVPYDPYFGVAIATIGDVTQDGRTEFVVGTQMHTATMWWQGKVAVYSPTKLTLRGTPHLVPLHPSKAQRLTVDFGEAHAGQPFLLLGTMAGTKPSLWVDGLPLALVPDDYTVLALNGVGIAQPWVGVLDGSGKAHPLAPIPPLSAPLKAALVGKSVWHVALTLGPAGTVSSISNPVSMTFLP
jgi:hypothetical protein